MKIFLTVACSVIAIPVLFAAESDDGFVRLTPEELEWTSRESGSDFVNIVGNPSEEGFYIYRLRVPPGSLTTPHYHDRDRFVTVISGTWYTATSADTDPEDMTPLPAGSFMKHPAGGWHFDGAKEVEVIVEIRGMGPVHTIRE